MTATTAHKMKGENLVHVKILKGPELKKLPKAIVYLVRRSRKRTLTVIGRMWRT
jgi:hypothetical protein